MKADAIRYYEFGPFQVDVGGRSLRRNGHVVPLPPKLFETLLVLLENAGHTLKKDELISRLWPDTFVDESSLAQNIFQLRKTLGEHSSGFKYIETIPRRGYRFSASVRSVPKSGSEAFSSAEQTVGLTSERGPHIAPPQAGAKSPNSKAQDFRRRGLFPLVIAVSIISAAILGYALRHHFYAGKSSSPAGEIKTLAVMPFRPLDAASDDEQLRLGMADALVSRLSNLPTVSVRPSSASLNPEFSQHSASYAGKLLRVDAVLDGTIQRSGDRLRMNVQLVRISDGVAVWSEKFDERSSDILLLQDLISQKVATRLVGTISHETTSAHRRRYTNNTEAYQQYVKGRHFWNRRTEEGYRKGIEHFHRAIEIDSGYALAYAGLADCYTFLGANAGTGSSMKENFETARAAVKQALELDPALAEAYTTLAIISSEYDGNWPQAEQAYLKAISLNYNYATAHHWYALDLLAAGRVDDSVAEIKKAQELDPLSLPTNLALGQIYFYLRRYDDAVKQLTQTLELDPHHSSSRVYLALAYEQKGMLDEALREFDRALRSYPEHMIATTVRAHTLAQLNRTEEAQEILAKITRKPDLRPSLICEVIIAKTALGDDDDAFRWLDKVAGSRSKNVTIRLRFDPRLDRFRSLPRWQSYFPLE